MPEVKDRILSAYDSLSKAQKKAADFIISNFDAAAMLSSIKLSLRAGISESTIVRLAYSLGYEGFSDLQKHIQQDYLTSFRGVPQTNSTTNEYEDMLASEIRNLQELQNYASDPTRLERIARILVDADMVEVFGYYGEHTVAFELYMVLDAIRPNVHYYRENNIGFREMETLNPSSAVISFLFDPYCPGTIELLQQAKEKGAVLITVTDSLISPGAVGRSRLLFPAAGQRGGHQFHGAGHAVHPDAAASRQEAGSRRGDRTHPQSAEPAAAARHDASQTGH